MTTDEQKVREVYPDAYVYMCKTYGGAKEYTCKADGKSLGPTTFTLENAWKYAAERLERSVAK